MTKQNEVPATGYVKKETMLWVATITLVVGFLMGVVVTVYKSSSGLPVPSAPPQSQPPPPQAGKQGPSVETAARIFELEKITNQNPNDAETWIQLGNLYFDSENHEKAINAYQKSLALKPDNADVLTDMGVMYRRSGKPAEAIKAFDKAIAVDPRHEVSRFNKGLVLMHDLNDIAGAVRAWEELAAVNPAAKSPNGQLISELVKRMQPPGKP
ncbi:MAG: tetratricopeptide repeat protein [Deltaproteobacteria bacterium]|nr:tetratricopeptide repeat protein [Deltaproteobacteria bacterium]